ncbi:Ig-like domain-containing protein [Corallococcus llansteffanensis]|uniref:SbsA Ig-like domain-containing protein n=1 Tax=Corallococcus llansteffanensis TaxID=2316731 RepID=A0A3A8QMW0_9BACT|nr:Ig-like domain-containing protein [Corallococcus llansteffanensis]RKH69158.1 hypothetical protein D7V93_00095 [Corallococcus llansteffanensis]
MPNPRLHLKYSLALVLALGSACVDIPPFEDPASDTGADAGFTQDAGPLDLQEPRLLTTAPASGSTHVPVETELVLSFSEAVQPASLLISVSPPVTLGAPVWTEDRTRVALQPASPLAEDTTYSVTVVGTDLAGNPIDGVNSFSFMTTGPQPDTIRPTVLSATPDTSAIGIELAPTLKVTFSEPMDKASTESSISFTTPAGFHASSFSWNTAATELTFKADIAFPHGTSVAWKISTLARDVAGNTTAADTVKNFRVLRLNTAMIDFDPETSGSLGAPSYFRQTPYYNSATVGDDGGPNNDRLYLGFRLDVLPEKLTRITFSQLRWPVGRIFGDPFGKLGELLLEPVDVGDIIEYSFDGKNPQTIADYHTPPLKDAFVVPPSTVPFRGEFDVTEWTAQDWQNRGIRNKRTQYRLRFQNPTNADTVKDQLYCDPSYNEVLAALWVTYEYP